MTATPVSPFHTLLAAASPPILTEAELARRMRMDRATVRHLRQGNGGRLSLIAASDALGISVDDLQAVITETIAWHAAQEKAA